jgi:hypothetical protein
VQTERSTDGEGSTGVATVGDTSGGLDPNDGIAIATRVDPSEPSGDERRSQHWAAKTDETGRENRRSDSSQVERLGSYAEQRDKSDAVDDRRSDGAVAGADRDISQSTERIFNRISQLDDNRHPEVQRGDVEARGSVAASASGEVVGDSVGDTPLAVAAAADGGNGGASIDPSTSDELKLQTDEKSTPTSEERRERDSYDGGTPTSVADRQQLAAIVQSDETDGVFTDSRSIDFASDQKPPLAASASNEKADGNIRDSLVPPRTVNDAIQDYEAVNKESSRHGDDDRIAHSTVSAAAAVRPHAGRKSSEMTISRHDAIHSVVSDEVSGLSISGLRTVDEGRRHTTTDANVARDDGTQVVVVAAAADAFNRRKSDEKVAGGRSHNDEESTLTDSTGNKEESRVAAAAATQRQPFGTDYIETVTESLLSVPTDAARIEPVNIALDRNEVDSPSAPAAESSQEQSATSKNGRK